MAKTKSSESEETGMGFKDKKKALDTLNLLDGRDISYQYHVIMSFVSRTKRILQITKDEEKLANLKEALQVFEDWLNDYKANNRGKENLAYLPIETVSSYRLLAKKYNVLDEDFYKAYKKEKGDYKSMRAVKVQNGETTWDIERNRKLKKIIEKIKQKYIQWYETDVGDYHGLPTKEHVQCIMLGYSPDPTKVKKLISQVQEIFKAENDEDMDVDEKEKSLKRNHESSTSSDTDDEQERKVAKMSEESTDQKVESELGFKDKESALKSMQFLEGRDINFQYHVITSLMVKAKHLISCTKDEQKIKNIKEAVAVFEKFMIEYQLNNRAKENLHYLDLNVVLAFKPLAERYQIEDNGFLKAYKKEKGDFKSMRTVKVQNGETTWDIERNRKLKKIIEKIKQEHIQWYETDVGDYHGLPTKEHVQCIMLGYSPDPTKVKMLISQVQEIFKAENDEDMDVDEKEKSLKRSHESSISSDEDDEQERKVVKMSEESTDQKVESELGFKDKESALKSMQFLEGRDINFQYHVITSLMLKAKHLISCTKDEQKIKNIKGAVAVFEKFMIDYQLNNRAKENLHYLDLNVVQAFKPLAERYQIEDNGFLKAYKDADGNYQKLRNTKVSESSTVTWDIERNKNLQGLLKGIKENSSEWFQADGELKGMPTEEHTECIMWAFSPDKEKLTKLLPILDAKLTS